MEGPSATDAERRCPDCGALVSADADWCGQCFARLGGPEPESSPGPTPAAPPPVAPAPTSGPQEPAVLSAMKAAAWPCPACGHENPIELDVCEVCGTSFAALMRAGEPAVTVEPRAALRRSLLFPGLGHVMVGRTLDGLAREILFAIVLGMTIIVGVSGLSSGVLLAVFALFAGVTVLVYVGSAWEAYRLAEGEAPILSSRALLWATVAIVMLSVALLAVAVATGTKR